MKGSESVTHLSSPMGSEGQAKPCEPVAEDERRLPLAGMPAARPSAHTAVPLAAVTRSLAAEQDATRRSPRRTDRAIQGAEPPAAELPLWVLSSEAFPWLLTQR